MTARAGDDVPSGPPAVIRESLQGKYAGFASRFTAFAVDVGVSLGVFMLALVLHDVIAGTAVIYSWDARAARLRFLSRG
jgi:hypothetical protein